MGPGYRGTAAVGTTMSNFVTIRPHDDDDDRTNEVDKV